jgi:hypothetical protein
MSGYIKYLQAEELSFFLFKTCYCDSTNLFLQKSIIINTDDVLIVISPYVLRYLFFICFN